MSASRGSSAVLLDETRFVLDQVLGAGRAVGAGLDVRGGAGGLVVSGTAMTEAATVLARTGGGLLDRGAPLALAATAGGPVAAALDPAGLAEAQVAATLALARLGDSAQECLRLAALLRAAGAAYASAEEVAASAAAGARDAVAGTAGHAVGALARRPEVVLGGGAVVLGAVTGAGLVWLVVRGGGLVAAVGDGLVADLADGRLDAGERAGLVADVRGLPGTGLDLLRGDLATVGGSALDELSTAAALHPEALELVIGGLPAAVRGAVGAPPGALARRLGGEAQPHVQVGDDRLAWPPADVPDLAAGLAVVLTQDGALRPTDVRVRREDDAATMADLAGQLEPATGTEGLLALATPLAGGGALSPGGRATSESAVVVQRVVDAGGTTRFVVVVPPTQTTGSMTSPETTNPADLGSDLRAVGHVPSAASRSVVLALQEAGARPQDQVLLVGYSQGGIVAAQLAADPALREVARVDAVLTAGAPVGGFDLPDDVAVLSLEHEEDWIRATDGEANPATPARTTVSRDLTATGDLDLADLRADGMAAHDLDLYRETAALVDASDDPSLVAYSERVAPYLAAPGTSVTTQVYRAERVPPR
ncbi:hypothetical protein [Pseudokineococcus sp. 1T1Z-3]|uniref:hypothetical protein n=1 Tax=Pseudokineococcus sp. 1T1Z-3 TaxID=3132745 RepID=UPI0030A038CC